MLTYDEVLSELEAAWAAVDLHEHEYMESVVPASHDRMVKVELFPEHTEPLTLESSPPWVELNFSWSAVHQLRSEGRNIASEPLDLNWTYNVIANNAGERNDTELVRMFQRAVHNAFELHYPLEAAEMDPVVVEVRRIYQQQREAQRIRQEYVQLVSINITDLSEQWNEREPRAFRNLIRVELQLVASVLNNLSETFSPTNGRGGYHSVDAA
jgi:hypothetical protein